MYLVYAMVRFYPWWAVPSALVLYELGVYFRRRHDRVAYRLCWLTGVALLASTGIWLFFRGDLHSDQWVRSVFG